MKLIYNILWFEDDESWYKTALVFIQEYLEENGFLLNSRRVADGTLIEELLNDNDVDLILMDYNLAGGATGDRLIGQIRDHELFTDIIFYSQFGAQTIREKVIGVDGIYCTNRDIELFEEKVTKIIKRTLKKVQDINNMRGLVMSETSELDHRMTQVIMEFCKISPEHIQTIVNKTLKNRAERIDSLKKLADKSTGLFLDGIESYDRYRAIWRILNESQTESLRIYGDTFVKYKEEIIDTRNLLAHIKQETVDGRCMLITRMPGKAAFTFNDETCIEIRKNIKKHSDNLDYILETLRSQPCHTSTALG